MLLLFINILSIGNLASIAKAYVEPLSIKITHPEKNSNTKIGSNLEIFGTSDYDPDNICHVSVIINDVKPYQKTTPTGTETNNDYSTWKYMPDPYYTAIKEGDNKITARLLCLDDHEKDLRKWYTIHVIGQEEIENRSEGSVPTTKLAIPASGQTGTPTIINIDRNVFIDLVNNRIENNADIIRDVIEDSTMSFYAKRET